MDVLPAGTLLHGYEILSVLGQGGFGITYRARHVSLGREVAIKEYLPRDLALRRGRETVLPRSTSMADDFKWIRDRFLEEARTLVKLEGVPGMVRVLDLFEANGTAYSVMALARGDTLERRIQKAGPLPAGAIEQLLWPLLDGLEQVHAAGFIHRDIKPANIIVDPAGRPTLIDFGAARMAMANRTVVTMTAMYTPSYAAPEQFASARQGPWTDIYGLAATLHCAITGDKPPSAMERSLDDIYEPLAGRAPPGFDPSLLAGIDAGMKLRPAERPQSIADWRALLQRPAAPQPAPAPPPARSDTVIVSRAPPSPPPPPPPPVEPTVTRDAPPPPPEPPRVAVARLRRVPWIAIAAGVLVLAVGSYAATSMMSAGEARQKAEQAQAAELQRREAAVAEQKRQEEETARREAVAAEQKKQEEEAARRQAAVADQKKQEGEAAQHQLEVAAAEKKKHEDEEAQKTAALKAAGRDCADCPATVAIPAGSYTMGAGPGEEEREKVPEPLRGAASPQHPVRIAKPFHLSRFEVTRGQFRAFVAASRHEPAHTCIGLALEKGQLATKEGLSWLNPGFAQTDDDPVVCVSWQDAKAYAEWLSKTTGKSYRLPSESEWEYAARAGTATTRPWGDDRKSACRFGNVSDKTFMDWGHWPNDPERHFDCADGFRTTAPVGRFAANAFGLHDMLGNAWEWVEDCWNDNHKGAPEGQEARTTGRCEVRVLRGASWLDVPSQVRTAVRSNAEGAYRSSLIGFRIARAD